MQKSLCQYRLGLCHNPFQMCQLYLVGDGIGIDARTIQYLTGIDIADTRHNALIHQRRFDGYPAILEPLLQIRSVKLRFQRFSPQSRQVVLHLIQRAQRYLAKGAGINKAQAIAFLHSKISPLVPMRLPLIFIPNQLARHP